MSKVYPYPIDLHLHADGAISYKSARQICALQNISVPESDDELKKLMTIEKGCRDLNSFLSKFDFILSILHTPEAVETMVFNLLAELEDIGMKYVEIRFAPSTSVGEDFSVEQAVEAAVRGLKRSTLDANIILCCMRGKDNHQLNIETVLAAKKYLNKGVCALDLAGAEAIFPTENFEDLFTMARNLGIPFTIHAGEAAGPESVWKALEFGACRIGHGVRSVEDQALLRELAEKKIPLELCPGSNIATGIYSDISEYPIRKLMEAGVIVTINSDNYTIQGTTLEKEYRMLIDAFNLTEEEVKKLLENSINASFASGEIKKELLASI